MRSGNEKPYFSDSHCHLDRFGHENLAQALEQARLRHVDTILTVGMNLESSAAVIRLAQSLDGVLAAVGIHPWEAVLPAGDIQDRFRYLTKQDRVAAIGEIGLDHVRNPETIDTQKELLSYELSLARETGLPVSVHCREAHKDMMGILRPFARTGVRGAIHGFSGDREALWDWLDLGFYVSIGRRGFLTDERPSLLTAVREIPLDRLLTETDSTGWPSSGPVEVVSVVEKLASLGMGTVEEIASHATANLKRLLKS